MTADSVSVTGTGILLRRGIACYVPVMLNTVAVAAVTPLQVLGLLLVLLFFVVLTPNLPYIPPYRPMPRCVAR